MDRLWPLVRRYGFDALIVLVAVASAFAAAFSNSTDAPQSTRWFTVPAIALLPLALLARRRFPLAAPAAVWILGAALSFVDGRLATFNAASALPSPWEAR
jgi:hypothetical protein